jgi:hypothetical protein
MTAGRNSSPRVIRGLAVGIARVRKLLDLGSNDVYGKRALGWLSPEA